MHKLQSRWDAYLINLFLTKPQYKMSWVTSNFKEKNKVPHDEFLELKRIPRYSRHFRPDLYGFFAQYLPNIYKIIEGKDPNDALYYALQVNKSGEDTLESNINYDHSYTGEAINIKNSKDYENDQLAKRLFHEMCQRANVAPGRR